MKIIGRQRDIGLITQYMYICDTFHYADVKNACAKDCNTS